MEETLEQRREHALAILRDLPAIELKGVRTFELFTARDNKTGEKVRVNKSILDQNPTRYTLLKSKKKSSREEESEEEELPSEDDMATMSSGTLKALPEFRKLKQSVRDKLTSKQGIISAILGRRARKSKDR